MTPALHGAVRSVPVPLGTIFLVFTWTGLTAFGAAILQKVHAVPLTTRTALPGWTGTCHGDPDA